MNMAAEVRRLPLPNTTNPMRGGRPCLPNMDSEPTSEKPALKCATSNRQDRGWSMKPWKRHPRSALIDAMNQRDSQRVIDVVNAMRGYLTAVEAALVLLLMPNRDDLIVILMEMAKEIKP